MEQNTAKRKKFGRDMSVRMPVVIIGVGLCLLIIFMGGEPGFAWLTALLCGISAFELNHSSQSVTKQVEVLSVITAALLPFIFKYTGITYICVIFVTFASVVMLLNVYGNAPKSILSVVVPVFASFIIPPMFICLLEIREMTDGIRLVVIPFITAWCSDGGAHIFGSLLGRHKLCPEISPNKTVEGFFGGVIGSVLGMLVYCAVLAVRDTDVSWLLYILCGVIGAVCGAFGDLFFSYLKRLFGIKDFGNMMPGHGGILDRFDSIVFCSPVFLLLFEQIYIQNV